MSDKKKSNWIEKMKSDTVLKTKVNEIKGIQNSQIEFNTKDSILYAFISTILSIICCVANQFLHFFVFKETIGIIGTILVGIGLFLFLSFSVNNMEQKVNDGKLQKDILVMMRTISVIVRDVFYYIALYKFIPTSILLFVIFGTTAFYSISNFASFERCSIGIYSLKSVLLQLTFAYSLYNIVSFKLFICIVSCVYLILLVQSKARPIVAKATKNGLEKAIEKDINSKFGDKLKVEVKAER